MANGLLAGRFFIVPTQCQLYADLVFFTPGAAAAAAGAGGGRDGLRDRYGGQSESFMIKFSGFAGARKDK